MAINNLSLTIRPGEYVAFVGESGSGKSTVIKLIEKFYRISGGSIGYGLYNQRDMKATHLRRQIGLVNQEATMFSGTVQDNITYGLSDYSLQDMEDAAERAGCLEFLRDEKRFPHMFQSDVG